MPNALQSILNNPTISRIRRNHGLEHATIHMMSRRHPNTTFIGRSDWRGFFFYGNVSTEELKQAVEEALSRLRRGESRLALHANCGTNFLTTAAMVATASFLALMGTGKEDRPGDRLLRLPLAIVAAVFALIVSQPLGATLQKRLTTSSDPGSLEIISIRRITSGRPIIHRILTRG
jgi:uncharacterized protein YqhQ